MRESERAGNGWGRGHVRRLATYSAAIFHLVAYGIGSALDLYALYYRPMEVEAKPTGHRSKCALPSKSSWPEVHVRETKERCHLKCPGNPAGVKLSHTKSMR